MSFLQETKLYLLLKIINEHINLSIMTAKPLTSAEIGGGKEAGIFQKLPFLLSGLPKPG